MKSNMCAFVEKLSQYKMDSDAKNANVKSQQKQGKFVETFFLGNENPYLKKVN